MRPAPALLLLAALNFVWTLSAREICDPGHYYTGSLCQRCSIIGPIDNYRARWYEQLRYSRGRTFAEMPLYAKWAELSDLEAEGGDPTLFEPASEACGLDRDGVRCPPGFVLNPGHPVPCLRAKAPAPEPVVCQVGFYAEEGRCVACPGKMTTMYPGAQDASLCSFCRAGSFLSLNDDAQEHCQPCPPSACTTTEGVGPGFAHRMTQCSLQCSPRHMHPDVAGMYGCDFETCFQSALVKDIHRCVFDGSGNLKNDADSASPCHNYFRPVTANTLEKMELSDKCQWDIAGEQQCDSVDTTDVNPFGLLSARDLMLFNYDSSRAKRSEYLERNNAMVTQRAQNFAGGESGWGGFFYRFHITNKKVLEIKDELPWAQLINVQNAVASSGGVIEYTNTEDFVVEKVLKQNALLAVKDLTTIFDCREDMSDCAESGNRAQEISGNFTELKWVDFVRGFHEVYTEQYVQRATDSCSEHLKSHEKCSVYFCNEKAAFEKPSNSWAFKRTQNTKCLSGISGFANNPQTRGCAGADEEAVSPDLVAQLLLNSTRAALDACNCAQAAADCDFECLESGVTLTLKTFHLDPVYCLLYSTVNSLLQDDPSLAEKLEGLCFQRQPFAPIVLWFCHPANEWMQLGSEEAAGGSLLAMARGEIPKTLPALTCPPFVSPAALNLGDSCDSNQSLAEEVARAKNVEYHRGDFRQKLSAGNSFFQHELALARDNQTLNCTVLQAEIQHQEPCLARRVGQTAFHIEAIRQGGQMLTGKQIVKVCMQGTCREAVAELMGDGSTLFPVVDTNSFAFAKKYINEYVNLRENKIR